METDPIEFRLREVLSRILGVSADAIAAETSSENTPEWDSLRHRQIVMSLEEAFSVRIPEREIPKLTSVAALRSWLNSAGVMRFPYI